MDVEPKKAQKRVIKKKRYPQRAPKTNYFNTLMDTPEGRAKRAEWSRKKKKNAGRPAGTPDGMTAQDMSAVHQKTRFEAEEVVAIMAEKFDIEVEYEKEALKTAVEIMRLPGGARDRLAAARLLLDFTKVKPVSQAHLQISQAEDFLLSLTSEGAEDESEANPGEETSTY